MSAIRFFTVALSLLASISTFVAAAPTASKRSDKLYPTQFAATGWGGSTSANSGIRIYMPQNGGIQEIVAEKGGLASHDQDWETGTFLQGDSFTVADDAVIAATNTFGVGGSEIEVFFLSSDMYLRNWEYSGGTWSLGSLADAVPNYGGSLNVNAWSSSNGYTLSMFYTENGGWIQELQRVNNAWSWVGTVAQITAGVEFTSAVTVENGVVTKTLWTADNVQWRWTSSNPTWVSVTGHTQFQASNIASIVLPDNEIRFYAAEDNDRNIYEYTMDNDEWNGQPTNTIKKATGNSGSHISVATQHYDNQDYIFVFYLNDDSELEVSEYNGHTWHNNDEEVKV